MEAALSFWMLVSVYQTVWCHIPGGCSLTVHWYENCV